MNIRENWLWNKFLKSSWVTQRRFSNQNPATSRLNQFFGKTFFFFFFKEGKRLSPGAIEQKKHLREAAANLPSTLGFNVFSCQHCITSQSFTNYFCPFNTIFFFFALKLILFFVIFLPFLWTKKRIKNLRLDVWDFCYE